MIKFFRLIRTDIYILLKYMFKDSLPIYLQISVQINKERLVYSLRDVNLCFLSDSEILLKAFQVNNALLNRE